jgi:CHASE3 domain sensor protein
MKNIKDLLNENDVTQETPALPKGHRREFLAKLETTEGIPSKKSTFPFWKAVAAACVLFVGIGAVIYTNIQEDETQESSLFAEMKSIEDQYLQQITSEWEAFQLTANDEYLVQKYKKRLTELDGFYQELKQQFIAEKNSLTTLEKMIKNLQLRLTLLQEIQQHLKRLKNEQANIS